MGSIIAIIYDDPHTDSDIGSGLTGFVWNLEMSVNPLHWVEVPSQAPSIHRIRVIRVADCAVDKSIECNQYLDGRSIAKMDDCESDVGQTSIALLDLVAESRDEMPREFLVNLVPPLFEFLGLELIAKRLLVIIMADPTVTLEAKRNGILIVVCPATSLGGDVMHLDENVACLLAKATVAITPEQEFFSELGWKCHVNSFSVRWRNRSHILQDIRLDNYFGARKFHECIHPEGGGRQGGKNGDE